MIRFINGRLILLLGFLFCCNVLSGAGSAVYAEDASIVRASQVDGSVTVNGKPLKDGDIIQRDDRIATKEKSAAILTWSNGSMVEIYPETSLVLKGVTFEGDNKLEKSLLTLERGRIFTKAQTPEHIFTHFEISVGNTPVMAQGAEFALKYEEPEKKFTIWSILGRVIVETGTKRIRVDDGQQVILVAGGSPGTPGPMPDKTRDALTKTSKRLGGSLLIEEELSSGGPLKAKIGGVRNRRGSAPYTVQFKAVVGGGSGKIKSIRWDFGDGESAQGKNAQHTFTQGVYVVVLTVEDEDGQRVTSQVSISVEIDCSC